MLNEEELRDAALLVFANKQDQPGAKGAGDISEALRLGELRDRNWSIVACSAVDGRGVDEGMDWLVVRRLWLYIFWGELLLINASAANGQFRIIGKPDALLCTLVVLEEGTNAYKAGGYSSTNLMASFLYAWEVVQDSASHSSVDSLTFLASVPVLNTQCSLEDGKDVRRTFVSACFAERGKSTGYVPSDTTRHMAHLTRYEERPAVCFSATLGKLL